ncbi:enoyl-[acyl-carrier-protein] reductase [NADH] [Arenicella chitinivorans]|uniref:Enoyl-[acyl-carrier-protein] reductase [NADH] n=1 Tax=Arenicella chitinivorans TaxID=1329800 RepID=A0A918VIE9_9GAMM|nr:enoyl-ACP reductase FabV [Arenicella chitinivorans]GGZ99992.1 enoyl-[acyl-carrier-protein] reductase [NADH] [Arenicella chitinivorans]
MIIKPKVRGFICTNAHPVGCAENVAQQIEYIKQQDMSGTNDTPKNVLVIGASTGYGLASRITAAYGYGAKTLGLFFEKPPTEKRTASAGFYNSAAFEKQAKADGLYAKSINGDAFSNEAKQQVIDLIKADMGQVDLVVYSLASPRRTDPISGNTYMSTLKPIGQSYTAKNLNTDTQIVGEVTVEPASEEEIANTIKVMGGEDWSLWIHALHEAGVLTDNAKTVAYTYIGEKLTKPIYGHATIGKAKEHLDTTAAELNANLPVQANVSVLKAVVTQASSAIPVMPLYLSILFKEMKAEGTHEGCIEQLDRLFKECIYSDSPRLDSDNRFRVDELELTPEMQAKVEAIWPQVTTENLHELSDFDGYKKEFLRLFGFEIDGVDYDADVSPLVDAEFL